jgi:hypothetical protein
MNTDETTGMREQTEVNGELRELTVDELNTVAGGSKMAPRIGYYAFSFMGMNFRGDNTGGSVSWPTPGGGLHIAASW